MGILWAIYGGFELLMAILAVTMARFYVSLVQGFLPPNANMPAAFFSFLRVVWLCSGILAFVTGALSMFAGWTLLRREPYGRTMALVAAFVSLIRIPIGTALGVYTLVELLPASAREVYVQLAIE
jgi:hypothetical protein